MHSYPSPEKKENGNMNEKMANKKSYFSPKVQTLETTEYDVIRTSNGTGAKMDWNGEGWGSFGNQGGEN